MPQDNTLVVCDLTVFSRLERVAQLNRGRAVFGRASQTVALENETRFYYEGDEQLFCDIALWATEEHKCCAWLSFSVTLGSFLGDGRSRIELSLTGGGAEGQAMVRDGIAYYATITDADAAVEIMSRHDELTPAIAHEIATGGSAA